MDISGETTRGTYSKASSWINSIGDHWMSKIDIKEVNRNLMKTAEHGSTYRGRGREVKFQK